MTHARSFACYRPTGDRCRDHSPASAVGGPPGVLQQAAGAAAGSGCPRVLGSLSGGRHQPAEHGAEPHACQGRNAGWPKQCSALLQTQGKAAYQLCFAKSNRSNSTLQKSLFTELRLSPRKANMKPPSSVRSAAARPDFTKKQQCQCQICMLLLGCYRTTDQLEN